jgi:hypothetical protein
MPKYLIERELPGAGKLSPAELKAISQKSCSVLNTTWDPKSNGCKAMSPTTRFIASTSPPTPRW